MNALGKWFGPSKKEIWHQLCTETGADYIPGGFWKGEKVQATHNEWTITLDTYAVSTGKTTIVFTRLRAPYVNPEREKDQRRCRVADLTFHPVCRGGTGP
jgi:hypothetical protein